MKGTFMRTPPLERAAPNGSGIIRIMTFHSPLKRHFESSTVFAILFCFSK